MIIQLPNGNTAEMTLDKYLEISDEEYNELLWKTTGSEIEDPFFDSTIKKKRFGRTSDDYSPELVSEDTELELGIEDAEEDGLIIEE